MERHQPAPGTAGCVRQWPHRGQVLGRPLQPVEPFDLTRRFHPFSSSVNAAFRNWSDANGNYIPDCNLQDFTANGECGVISDVNFGKFIPSSTTFSDDVPAQP